MIITDNSVFYDISAGAIPKESFNGVHIAATLMNIQELSSSYKIVTGKMNEVKGASEAIKNCCNTIINVEPYDFLLTQLVTNHRADPIKYNMGLQAFNSMLNDDFVDTERNRQIGREIIDNHKKPLKDSVDKVNLLLSQRTKIRQSLKTDVSLADLREGEKDGILHVLEINNYLSNPNEQLPIAKKSTGWENLEFFLTVWTDFHKDFIYKQGMKMQMNDWVDLWMMAYVGKNDKFWTMDTDWIKLINKNPITSKYLFPLSGLRI